MQVTDFLGCTQLASEGQQISIRGLKLKQKWLTQTYSDSSFNSHLIKFMKCNGRSQNGVSNFSYIKKIYKDVKILCKRETNSALINNMYLWNCLVPGTKELFPCYLQEGT